jgi:hypothetical protein
MRLLPCAHEWFNALTTSVLLLLGGYSFPAVSAPASPVVYATDFETGAGPEWSAPTVDASHTANLTRFLGRFGNEEVALALNNLVAGTSYSVVFDLYVLDSWDGSGGNGPDIRPDWE